MKTISLLIALLLSGAVNAQGVESEKQAVESEKLWMFLLFVAGNDDDPNSGMDFSEDTGISEAGGVALKSYARNARDESNRIGTANAQALCTSREALRDREALARRLEANAAQQRNLQQGFVDNLGTVLSPDDEAKVRNWLVRGFKGDFGHQTSIGSEVRSGHITPDQILARACPSPEDIARWQAMEKAQIQAEPKRPMPQQIPPVEASEVRRLPSAGVTPARPSAAPSLIALSKPPGYSQCEAWAINNVGLIVGMCWNGKFANNPVPVRWRQGVAEILNGQLRSEDSAESDVRAAEGMAVGVNDAGDIVGSILVERAPNRHGMRAAIWEEGYWRDLGLPKGAQSMSARGINARGDVIGSSNGHAAVYWRAENRFEILPSVPNSETATCSGMAINNQGQAVGMCTESIPSDGSTSDGLRGDAVLWQNHTAVVLANPCAAGEDMTPYARTISDSGVIGGTSGLCALVWHASTPDKVTIVHDRGVVNSINRRGDMVGSAGDPAAKKPLLKPARWADTEAPAIDLGPGASTDGRIRFINDRGVFVGGYTSATGESFAFVSQ